MQWTNLTYQRKTQSFRKLRKIDIEKFNNDLKLNISAINNTDELDILTTKLSESLKTVLNDHAPLQSMSLPNKSLVPWFSDEIRAAITKRRQLEKKWRNNPIEVNRQIFRQARNDVCHLIEKSKKTHYNSEIENCKGDQKKNYMPSLIVLCTRKQENKLPTGSVLEIVDSFSQYFVTKIDTIRKKIIETSINSQTECNTATEAQKTCSSNLTSFHPATEDEVKKIISKSKSATCELDSIPTNLLKKCLPTIIPLLTKIINLSMSSGTVPSTFKYALVKPLIKKASLDPENMKNFRPISNLPFLSKVLEKVILKRLSDYMSENNLHEVMQSAYKPNHSTETALIRIQNDILRQLDRRNGMVLVLLDLSAAFDTIDHQILLNRLKSKLGITGSVLDWFSSYLSGRSCAVSISQQTSSPSSCVYRVPQGSLLITTISETSSLLCSC